MTSPFHNAPNVRCGFTLVELMVVIVIVSILSALSLAGLNIARKQSKIDVTRATIRKLDSHVMDQFDSYAMRITGTSGVNLQKIRATMTEEMPDSWLNVWSGTANLSNCVTASGRGYLRYRLNLTPTPKFRGAECLYMIVTRSGFSPSALEDFRPQEVGDADGDGAKEFLDAWGNPIEFMRWAPGFSSDVSPIPPSLGWGPPSSPRSYSAIQLADPDRSHDYVDAGGIDSSAFQMYPLIYSAGPDQAGNEDISGYGLLTTGSATGWPKLSAAVLQSGTSPLLKTEICIFPSESGGGLVGEPDSTTAFRDNITNHDFARR
jgi:prepilin-type N-terminal cleavage/methylation domain-containing protein